MMQSYLSMFHRVFRGLWIFTLLLVMLALFSVSDASVTTVVGTGTPASCTNAAINNAILNGGLVTFNCGPGNVTIPIGDTIYYDGKDIASDLEIDGGNRVTLQGTPGNRIIRMRTYGLEGAARTLTLRNITIADASISGSQQDANGGAIYVTNNSRDYPDEPPTVNLYNVTFTNNVTQQTNTGVSGYDYGGGAIMIWGGNLNVYDSTFTNNGSLGSGGGAIHGLTANIRLQNSTFQGNYATVTTPGDGNSGWGGAFYVDGARPSEGGTVSGQIVIVDSTFDGNTAGTRGGFAYIDLYMNRNETLQIIGSTFVNNRAEHSEFGMGGALVHNGIDKGPGVVTSLVLNSMFYNNTAYGAARGGSGGAAYFLNTNLTIANSTFYSNHAEGTCDTCYNATAGALYIRASSVPFRIFNTTIANNTAWWSSGAINGDNGVLKNTILANNSAANFNNNYLYQQHCSGMFTNGGNNLQYPLYSEDNRCADGITIADPLLGNFTAEGVLEPAANSPAVDTGNNSVCEAFPIQNVDQRGVTRPFNGICDIGSVEYVSLSAVDVVQDGYITPADAVYQINRNADPAMIDLTLKSIGQSVE